MSRRKASAHETVGNAGLFICLSALGILGWAWLSQSKPSGGKDWRGFAGTVALQPGVVYRIEFRAPFSRDPARDMTKEENQASVQQTLESGGAKQLAWSVRDDGMYLTFDQSFPDARTLTFGKGGVGPMTPVTARRVDGLDWSAP